MINESEFDNEFKIVLTKDELMRYYGVYNYEDIDRID